MSGISSKELEELKINGWIVLENGKKIKKEFRFKDFKQSVDFLKDIQPSADALDHHPDVCVYYNRVVVELTTHDVGGLTDLDYKLAIKLDELYKMKTS
ncbi:4a-hydroxytetrahydrobiopterin dehydratase [Saccharolobus solfataricus]|uniref:Putative pterin-4-alpha-carbinolamine dehydratase n=4 Tax=Saccharolobus solfataricus TaxID=2287 RepID=PHS_SACS2|nr:4a-hydroxytetrahydrobiopterin dehydratase [Saccharolobus solfataricus]Q97WM6.2 RecName: Full=Putative pterin-4-alpha-carbinolamine dehydratase; Short=PHS; AltName: Full=4-alpha-hydroxy-tetrahydropterin dehydratase; AltName: Full=Pterin carbinolamine dehydratase; Short=PCD [Saccharolobus solfataricus P2]AKA74975.1 4a-hydroxytetrahydrobiopterin dehydratase [Saccharolobus solfataricus]AKA77670.1 4a-hydroxytetrahydrobiopterin dehydratase [Saccharolobus solfataricus]AKA80361.1 4a-hydroxytetrahydr